MRSIRAAAVIAAVLAQGMHAQFAVAPQPEVLRVPSLRNVATTAPYFHDGSAPTLDDAVRKMGLAQLNANLTDGQIKEIVAYLGTLTGTFRGKPVGGAP